MSDAYWSAYNNASGAADKVRRNVLARQAGGMMADGDVTGARNALYRGGELQAGGQLDTQIGNQRKAKAEAASRWAKGLDRMMSDPRYASNPEAAYAAAMPFAERLGLDPREVEADKQLFVRDPKGYATMLTEKAAKELQFFQTDTGIYVGDKGTGDVRRAARLPGKPVVVGDYAYMPEDVEGDERGLVAPAPPPANGMPQGSPTGRYSTPIQGGTPGFNSGVKYDRQVPAETYREAIAGIESRGSGDYSAQGPRTRTGDRAYGRYQVMGANIPQWTQEVLGRRMTPQEFLANPQAQDAVFDAKFGGYVQQYGSPEEAASVWFTGKPMAQGANRRDVNGMTGARYVQKFAQNAGVQPLQGGPQGDDLGQAPQIPGMRVVGRVKGGEAGEKWTSDGKGYLVNKNGDVKEDPRFATAAPGKPTDGDKQATAFAYRTIQASKRMAALADRGIFKPETVTAQLFERDKNGALRLVTKTSKDRLFMQAAKEWLAPVLRKDTGAAVTDEELASYMDIYIPRYEDDQQLMQQKAEARLDAMKALTNIAGPLYERTYGKPQFTSKYPAAKAPGGAQPPPAAVSYLRANPKLRAQFDQKYGKGAAAKVLGK